MPFDELATLLRTVSRDLDSFVREMTTRIGLHKAYMAETRKNGVNPREAGVLGEELKQIGEVLKAVEQLDNSMKNAETILPKLAAQTKKDQELIAQTLTQAGAADAKMRAFQEDVTHDWTLFNQKIGYADMDFEKVAVALEADPNLAVVRADLRRTIDKLRSITRELDAIKKECANSDVHFFVR